MRYDPCDRDETSQDVPGPEGPAEGHSDASRARDLLRGVHWAPFDLVSQLFLVRGVSDLPPHLQGALPCLCGRHVGTDQMVRTHVSVPAGRNRIGPPVPVRNPGRGGAHPRSGGGNPGQVERPGRVPREREQPTASPVPVPGDKRPSVRPWRSSAHVPRWPAAPLRNGKCSASGRCPCWPAAAQSHQKCHRGVRKRWPVGRSSPPVPRSPRFRAVP